MKKIVLSLSVLILLTSCEQSEGLKFGTVQKVSHKTFPCNYYEIQVSYEGGKAVSSGESSSFENTQDIQIDAAAYDTLQNYVGERVVFDYTDNGIQFCAPSKILTSIRIK